MKTTRKGEKRRAEKTRVVVEEIRCKMCECIVSPSDVFDEHHVTSRVATPEGQVLVQLCGPVVRTKHDDVQ